MIVHKLLIGEGAGTYLPFALARLRELESIDPDGFFEQTFKVDGATINVRQVGNEQFIRITIDGGFYFEFATSGFPVKIGTYDSEGLIFGTYFPVVVGVDVTTVQGEIKTKPRIRAQKRAVPGAAYEEADELPSATNFDVQSQLIHEPTQVRQLSAGYRANYKYPDIMYGTWCPMHSFTGIMARDTEHGYSFQERNYQAATSIVQERDYYYDYGFGYSSGKNPQTKADVIDEADWPRKNGLQTVKDDKFGTRTFGIYLDVTNKFHVFPLSSIEGAQEDHEQNITADHIRHLNMEYPYWMRAPDVKIKEYTETHAQSDAVVHIPEYQWWFNPAGTKAVAVAYGVSEFKNDDAFWAVNPDPDTPWNTERFERLRIWMSSLRWRGYDLPSDIDPERYFYGSGVVEVEIIITLTGTDPNDYDVELKTTTHRDPNITPYCALFAGYARMDIPGKTVDGVKQPDTKAGDLLVIDVQGYSYPHYTTDNEQKARHIFYIMRNFTRETELFATWAHPIVAVDLSTASFVMRVRHLETVTRTAPRRSTYSSGAPYSFPYETEHFGLWVVQEAAHKDILFPETMETQYKEAIRTITEDEPTPYVTALLNNGWELIPLAHPADGWQLADYVAFREHASATDYFWYNDIFVREDPDWDIHGSSYPLQGYLYFRTGMSPGAADIVAEGRYNEVLFRYFSSGGRRGSMEHLMFCDNPRFGWHFYSTVITEYVATSAFHCFYTHPSGSYTFFSNAFIYDKNGLPLYSYEANVSDTLSPYDAALVEHCIFDRVHLEVKQKAGKAASVNTTFMALYNKAVQDGKDAETLEEGIDTMTTADQRGIFTKETATYVQDQSGAYWNTLALKFSWFGKEWWYIEPWIRSDPVAGVEPSILFPPTFTGGLHGLTLDEVWYRTNTQPTTSNDLGYPTLPRNKDDPSTCTVRFANSIIIAE